jgi:hypothetical protein
MFSNMQTKYKPWIGLSHNNKTFVEDNHKLHEVTFST